MRTLPLSDCDDDLREARAQALADDIRQVLRHDHAADRRALLARLARHLARDFLDEQVQFLVVRRDVRREDGGVQRIRFRRERHGFADQVRVAAQFRGRVGRSREGHRVESVQAVQQVARRADDELQAAFRQQFRLHHHPDQRMREIARRGGRLGDAGHRGEEARCEFFQQAPDRKIKSVDVHGDAAARHEDVRAREAAPLAERHGRPFVQHVRRRQFAPADAGVREQRADAALDVDPAVRPRGARQVRDLVQLFLPLHQVRRQGFQALGAFLEVHLHQRLYACLAGIRDGFAEVDPVGVRVVDQLVVQGAVQRLVRLAAEPAAGDQALQGGW
ncbi:conserved hypothetical protein, partial [Ricinus communis]